MESTATSISFKALLASLPRGEPLSSASLQARGLSAFRASALARSGWLLHLARGVYMLPGDTLTRDGCLAFLATQTPGLHVAGKTALAWRGVRKNISFREHLSLWGEAPKRLPMRRGHRRRRARRGPFADLRRTLRDSVRNDGEFLRLSRLRRRKRPRKLLLLIDVSGSMKERTEDNLRLAHVLTQAAPAVETFTFGTRLTRVTRALRLKRREQALRAAAGIVSDWDGGTRIGDALQAFLAVPRFAGYARGAAVLVISDGLERGDVAAMRDAASKLSRRAWTFDWLTPLAVTRAFTPQTAGLSAIRPFVDEMTAGGSSAAIVAHILALGSRRAA